MNERLPYEEQLAEKWDDLPLPDEQMAWADMQRRLDEEDDRPLLPFWLRGCAGWALLGLVLLGLGWWLLRPEKWFTQKNERQNTTIKSQTGSQQQSKKNTVKLTHDTGSIKGQDNTLAGSMAGTDSTGNNKNITAEKNVSIVNPVPVKVKKNTGQLQNPGGVTLQHTKTAGEKVNRAPATNKEDARSAISVQNGSTKKRKKPTVIDPVTDKKAGKDSTENNIPGLVTKLTGDKTDSLNSFGIRPVVKDSLITKLRPDTALNNIGRSNPTVKDTNNITSKKPPQPVIKKNNKDSSAKQPLEWSAGIGLQQQLPVSGQKWSPYNAQGRKNSLADYIPSVYVRLSKPQKWFLQAEFRYGAPQNTKEFTYREAKVSDTGSAPRFYYQTSSRLNRTFYHQVPLVFNYYIRPGWSVGTGIQWNNFYRAVSEKQVNFHNNITGTDTVLSKIIQPEKRDTASEFKKSFLQAILETQYKWKRFSFGARYSFGLQPFMEFTLPGGGLQKEKISSLQLFIRFELWRPSKKSPPRGNR